LNLARGRWSVIFTTMLEVSAPPHVSGEPFVGLQIEGAVFQNRDPGEVLDEIQRLAPVNALMVFHGWGAPKGLLHALREPAAQRGIALIAQIGERPWSEGPGMSAKASVQMVDPFGRRLRETCLSHPAYRDFQLAAVEGLFREHPFLSGAMFMHERRGPLSALLGGGGEARSRRPYCFCGHCRAEGARRGIDPERARQGLARLYHLFETSANGAPVPGEGWFITFWRILTEFPEILGWERLFYESLHQYRAGLVGAIKALDTRYHVGYHVQNHTMLMDFAWRAGDRPEVIAEYADWIKLSVYPAVSGTRGKGRLRKMNRTLLADLPDSTGRDFLRGIMGRTAADEPDWFAESPAGFAPSWIEKEIRRWKQAVPDRPVYSGLGIGVPGGEAAETPEYITACTQAGYDGGADGILLSRDYGEMRQELVAAAGRVIASRRP